MAATLVRDLLSFSIQIALVTVAIAVLLKIVRIPARVRYVGLRVALVALLVTPWLLRVPANLPVAGPVLAPVAAPASSLSVVTGTSTPADGTSAPAPRGLASLDIPWAPVLLGALLIGMFARGLWLVIGFARLRRLTRRGTVVDADYAELQQQMGTRATITEVVGVAQPATFGVRRAVVMLPDALAAAPESLRRAVITHELFHVRRRDWLSVLAEEMVRTLLWFHPAILWLTSHIQLAREEIVDELTVRETGDRRTYMQALLSFADTPGPRPAPAFAHRRQLFHRILSVSKENVMSRPRIVMSAGVLIAAVCTASWYASVLFPIISAARADMPTMTTTSQFVERFQSTDTVALTYDAAAGFQRSAASVTRQEPRQVTPENPIPRRTRGRAPAWPSQAASGRVAVNTVVTVDRNGEVIAVESRGCALSGRAAESNRNDTICRAFYQTTESALRQWGYDRPVQAPLQFAVIVYFIEQGVDPFIRQGVDPAVVPSEASLVASRRSDVAVAQSEPGVAAMRKRLAALTSQYRELERAYRVATERFTPQHPEMMRLQMELARLNDEVTNLLRTNVASEEQLALARQLEQAAQSLEASRRQPEPTVTGGVRPTPTTPFDQSPQLRSPSGRAPIRVGGGVQSVPRVLKSVHPQYSLEAMQARLQGTVQVEALIDEQGRVADARVLKSIPLLDESALAAAKQWEFTPTLLNGEPVPVLVMLEMHFTLK